MDAFMGAELNINLLLLMNRYREYIVDNNLDDVGKNMTIRSIWFDDGEWDNNVKIECYEEDWDWWDERVGE